MDEALAELIVTRGLAISLREPDDPAALHPFIEFVREGVVLMLPMPWKRNGFREDPVGLLYTALITVQVYNECDDFLDWCDELELEAVSSAALNDFRAMDRAIRTLTEMVGPAWGDITLRIAMGQAIAKAANRD
jgi:hypothetical protein